MEMEGKGAVSMVDDDPLSPRYSGSAKCAFAVKGQPAFQIDVGDFRSARIAGIQKDIAKQVRIAADRQEWTWLGQQLKCEFATLADYEIPENSDKAIMVSETAASKDGPPALPYSLAACCARGAVEATLARRLLAELTCAAEVLRERTILLAQDMNEFGVNMLGPGGIAKPDRLITFQAEVQIGRSAHKMILFDDHSFLVLSLYGATAWMHDQPYSGIVVFAKLRNVNVLDVWGSQMRISAPDWNNKGQQVELDVTCASDMQACYWCELLGDSTPSKTLQWSNPALKAIPSGKKP